MYIGAQSILMAMVMMHEDGDGHTSGAVVR